MEATLLLLAANPVWASTELEKKNWLVKEEANLVIGQPHTFQENFPGSWKRASSHMTPILSYSSSMAWAATCAATCIGRFNWAITQSHTEYLSKHHLDNDVRQLDLIL